MAKQNDRSQSKKRPPSKSAKSRSSAKKASKVSARSTAASRPQSKSGKKVGTAKAVRSSAAKKTAVPAKKSVKQVSKKKPSAPTKSAAKKAKTPTRKTAAKKATSSGAKARRHARPESTGTDREGRIEYLRRQIEEIGGEFHETDPDLPEELEEMYLESVLEFETAGWSRPYDVLIESGLSLPEPHQLSEEEITAKLWEVMGALALMNVYVLSTDHLSDRQLYHRLITDSLQEETVMIPHNPAFRCYIDLVSSGSDEDIECWLTYYADEDDRDGWVKQFPDSVLPERRNAPFNRDARLPRPTDDFVPGVH